MPKKSDYSGFAKFALDHSNLEYNQLETLYRQQGGHIKRQTGQEIVRQIYGFNKGEKRGETLQQKYDKARAKEYVYTPPVKRNKIIKNGVGSSHKSNYISLNINDKSIVRHISAKSPAVQRLVENIHNQYGYDTNTFIQIGLECVNDGYSQKNPFSVLLPYNGRTKQGVKKIALTALNNLLIFYTNLAKKYSTAVYYCDLKLSMNERIKAAKKLINEYKGLDEKNMIRIFNGCGIKIKNIIILKIEDEE